MIRYVIGVGLVFLLLFLTGKPRVVVLDNEERNPLLSFRFSDTPLSESDVYHVLDDLEESYGTNKVCVNLYRPQLLAALSFYPELINTHVEVISSPLKTSMAARPIGINPITNQRKYAIFIDDITKDKSTDFRKSVFWAQVGCLIHELAHIAHYESQRNINLIQEGIQYYFSQSFKSKYEKLTDRIAVAHGGGYYVYKFSEFIFHESCADARYLSFKKKHYYSDSDLYKLFLKSATTPLRGLSTKSKYIFRTTVLQ